MFSYTVSDNHGASSTTTDTVSVTGTWQPPITANDTAATRANQSVTINVLANDTDPEPGQTLSVSSLNLIGTNGSAVVNANGTITYTPGAAFAGLAPGSATTDGFSYTVSDGHGGNSTANVTVTVSAPGSSAAGHLAFYVATDGNDAWAGDLAAPNAGGTDGPLATLQAAQAKMEASTTTKTTYVEGGSYYLNSTLTLGTADNGESWLADPGQTPVIYGAQQVTGWVQGSNGVWTAPAPTGSLAQGSALTDLFVNGAREIHARYPDYAPTNPVQGGWLTAAASLPNENTSTSFQFNPGDVPVFSSTSGLYVSVYQQNGWQSYSVPVASINYTTDTITLGSAVGGAIGQGSRYYIYNASSQLNATNEWYGNSTSNTISLDAPAGFTGTGVTIGSLANIIQVNGASNVTIAGLTLEDTTTTGSAIRANGTTNLTLAGNTINNVGNGITLANNGSGTDIEGNIIENTDNYGVLVNPGTNYVTIKGNTIQNIGQQVNGDGVWFTGSSNDTIVNNLVQNVAHDGIGGSSIAGASQASVNNTISYNQVSNTNQDSSDGGGIYVGGPQLTDTNDTISYNEVSGTTAVNTANTAQTTFLSPSQLVGFGIYLDDYASGVNVTGNLLYDNVGGVDIHAGSNNTMYDNIIANTSNGALENVATNQLNLTTQPPSGNVFKDNLVSNTQPGGQLAVNLGDPSNAVWIGNFYDAAGLSNTAFVSDTSGAYKVQSLAGWQALGYDSGAVSGNPGFVPGSYTLASGSAASAAGITNPPLSQIGLAGFTATNSYDLYGH
jgi:VCBS repeat-containing protein